MGLYRVNVRGYSIEAIRFNGLVIGFKLHRRTWCHKEHRQKDHILLRECTYFVDAANFIADEMGYDDDKRRIFVFTLTEVYAEGDDFH